MVHVKRNGEILVDGESVGWVSKVDLAYAAMGSWRAEVGDPANPGFDEKGGYRYRVVYAKTRKAAVAAVLEQ